LTSILSQLSPAAKQIPGSGFNIDAWIGQNGYMDRPGSFNNKGDLNLRKKVEKIIANAILEILTKIYKGSK